MTSVTCPNCNSGHQIPDEARAFRCPTCAADVRYYEQAPMRPPPPGWQPGWYAGQGTASTTGTLPHAAGKGDKPIWKRPWVWVVGIILLLIIGSLAGGDPDTGTGGDTATDTTAEAGGGGGGATGGGGNGGGGGGGNGGGDDSAGIGDPAEPDMTVSQENAIESAETYLDFGGFSKKGLFEQLSSKFGEGFSKNDAIFAVNHVDVDWNKEAVESAKSYLETSSFSRQGLIGQLSSPHGDQYTKAQAVYAVNQVGL